MGFIRVCAVADLAPGDVRRFEDAPEPIAIFNLDGTFYALADQCTHGDWPLSEGFVEGDEIECSLHAGSFCIKTGAARKYPVTEPVRIYPVRVEDGFIDVDPAAGSYAAETP